MQTQPAKRSRQGFTLAELLVVMAIIMVLAAILVPTLNTARRKAKEGAARLEIRSLETAMTAYFTDWGLYPPDRTPAIPGPSYYPADADSARCLVYFLETPFRVGGSDADRISRNGGPYFDFPSDRLDADRRFVDLFGKKGRSVYSYRFDNNDAEDGDSTNWTPGAVDTDYNGNYTNVHPTGVDIWSAGLDGEDEVVVVHPTQTDLKADELGDDIGNW